jgi:hypothetical protein
MLMKQAKQESLLPWPEEDTNGSRGIFSLLTSWYRCYSYSYMNRVLNIGAKQQPNDDGTYLQEHDLYFVPSSIESQHLVMIFK